MSRKVNLIEALETRWLFSALGLERTLPPLQILTTPFVVNPQPDAKGIVFSGGAGVDRADFSASHQDLYVSLDNVPDDGPVTAASASCINSDVEQVFGGSGNDTLIGADGHNDTFQGNAG